MFLFAIAGNSTFTLSILAASLKQRYLIANASWLVGKPRCRTQARSGARVLAGRH
jgi:hypothetical protein